MKYAQVNRSLNFNLLRVCCYYLQRIITQPFLRSFTISILRYFVGARTLPHATNDPLLIETLLTLRTDGIVPLGQIFTAEQCSDIMRYLKEKNLSHKNYPDGVFTSEFPPENVRLGDYSLVDLVQCPHVLAACNSAAMLELAGSYLGCTPTISGLSARWSFAAESSNEVVQQFHRDSEDWKAFRIMVYLTDVTENSGPHAYVKGTHLDRRSMRLGVHAPAEINKMFDSKRIVRQTGAQGFGFAVDTAGLHRGEVPKDAPRLMLSFQYSILPCYLYEYEPVSMKEFPYSAYINRLICSGGKPANH